MGPSRRKAAVERLAQFDPIGRNDDGQIWHCPHDRNVENRLMAGSIIRIRKPRVVARQDDRQFVVANDVADLIGPFQRQEHGKGADDRPQAAGRHAGRDIHHVRFRHADVEKPVRVTLSKRCRARARGHVGIQDNHLGDIRRQRE